MQPHFGFRIQLLPNTAVEEFAKAFQTELVPFGQQLLNVLLHESHIDQAKPSLLEELSNEPEEV